MVESIKEYNILIIADNQNTYATQERLDDTYTGIVNNIKTLISKNNLTIFIDNSTSICLQEVTQSMSIENTICKALCIVLSQNSLKQFMSSLITNSLKEILSSTNLDGTITISESNLYKTIADNIKNINTPINITVCGLYENLNINIIFYIMKQQYKETKEINFIYNISGTLYSKKYTDESPHDIIAQNDYINYRDIIRMYDSIKKLKLNIPINKSLKIFYNDNRRYDLFEKSPETFEYKYVTSYGEINRENTTIVRNKIKELEIIKNKYKDFINQENKTQEEKDILIEKVSQEIEIAITQIMYDSFVTRTDIEELEAERLINIENQKLAEISVIQKKYDKNKNIKESLLRIHERKLHFINIELTNLNIYAKTTRKLLRIAQLNCHKETISNEIRDININKDIDTAKNEISKQTNKDIITNIEKIKNDKTQKLSNIHKDIATYKEKLDTYRKNHDKNQASELHSLAMKKYIKYKQKYLNLYNINKLVY